MGGTMQAWQRKGKRYQESNSRDETVTGQEPNAYELRLVLRQESKSTCVALASIANTASDETAGCFTQRAKCWKQTLLRCWDD